MEQIEIYLCTDVLAIIMAKNNDCGFMRINKSCYNNRKKFYFSLDPKFRIKLFMLAIEYARITEVKLMIDYIHLPKYLELLIFADVVSKSNLDLIDILFKYYDPRIYHHKILILDKIKKQHSYIITKLMRHPYYDQQKKYNKVIDDIVNFCFNKTKIEDLLILIKKMLLDSRCNGVVDLPIKAVCTHGTVDTVDSLVKNDQFINKYKNYGMIILNSIANNKNYSNSSPIIEFIFTNYNIDPQHYDEYGLLAKFYYDYHEIYSNFIIKVFENNIDLYEDAILFFYNK